MGFNSGFKGLNCILFIGPYIVIYSYSTTNKMHQLSQIIYSCKTLYMFRSFLPSLGAQNCVYSNGICQTAAARLRLKCDGTRAQKPDFVFRRKGRVHLNQRWASVQSTTGSRGVHISGSNAGYTMFRGSAKGTGCPLYSPVSSSLPPPVRHRVPSRFNWILPAAIGNEMELSSHYMNK